MAYVAIFKIGVNAYYVLINNFENSNYLFFFLVSDYVAGGELFTHLYQREHFTKDQVRIYIGEIILALEHLHSVSTHRLSLFFWCYT